MKKHFISTLCAVLVILGSVVLFPVTASALVESTPFNANHEASNKDSKEKQKKRQKAQSAQNGFLTMPFEKKCKNMEIAEGWFYSPHERGIHGFDTHFGVDFDCPRGTPIVAMADGYAIRSYHSFILDREYQGKSVGFGLGEFVQIWHPDQGVYSLYAHMDKSAENINYVETQKVSDTFWNPVGIYRPTDEIMNVGTPVKRGQVIGYVGDSGIQWGYEEDFQLEPPHHVIRPNPETNPSWDDTHVHTEIYTRTADGSVKDLRFDPFDIYGQVRPEYNPYKKMRQGENGLWLTKKNGKPCYPQQFYKRKCE